MKALKLRFPKIVGPDVKDICYATQNRQAAVRELTKQVDLLLVVGARNSSNSNRLREIGHESGVPTYLLEDVKALDAKWLEGVETVGITAGASTPEELVRELIEKLGAHAKIDLTIMHGIEEHIQFKLPDQLRPAAA